MGVYLPKPKTEKESEDGGEFPKTSTRFGLSAIPVFLITRHTVQTIIRQGWRQYMEDAHIADPAFNINSFESLGIFGVFDGHGGPAVSSWVAQEFRRIFRDELISTEEAIRNEKIRPKRDFGLKVVALCEALQRTFLRLDVEMGLEDNRESLKKIHEEFELRKKEEYCDEDAPRSLLDSLLASVAGTRPIIQVVERDGQRLYRIVKKSDTADDDDDAEEEEEEGYRKAVLDGGVEGEGVNSEETEDTSIAPADFDFDSFSGEGGCVEDMDLTKMVDNNRSPVDNTDQAEGASDFQAWKSDLSESLEDDDEDITTAEMAAAGALLQPHQPECCGATAIVAAVLGNVISSVRGEDRCLVTANAGDSRAVLCRNGTAIALSRDHKPVLRGENRRILEAGGKVVNGRVDGNLNLSRALGDLYYKQDVYLPVDAQKIISLPDVRVVPITPADQFVILACDGIWDCLNNQEAVNFVLNKLNEAGPESVDSLKLSQICEMMCDSCLCPNPLSSEGGIGCDNMTVMIVLLSDNACIGSKTVSNDVIESVAPAFYGEEPEEQDYEECLPILPSAMKLGGILPQSAQR